MTRAEIAEPGTSAALAREAEHLLRAELDGEVQFDDYSRHLFARDASMYSIMPLGVVFPRHADDVAATVRVANRLGIVVTPRGAGTSLAGQTIGAGIVLDCSRHLNRILELDPEARTARVEVGVVQDELNRRGRPVRADVRAGHLDQQPGDHRRHVRQQLRRQRLGALRHDDRPRARGRRRAVRRLARPLRAGGRGRAAPPRRARTPSRAGSTGGSRRSSRRTGRPSRPGSRRSGAGPAATGSTA